MNDGATEVDGIVVVGQRRRYETDPFPSLPIMPDPLPPGMADELPGDPPDEIPFNPCANPETRAVMRSWLRGRDRPNLYASLDWLSEIVIPSIHTGVRTLPAPTWSPRTPPPRPAHGPIHKIEGHGWAPDFDLARMSMSSTSGFLAQWGESTARMLEDCWRDERPFQRQAP